MVDVKPWERPVIRRIADGWVRTLGYEVGNEFVSGRCEMSHLVVVGRWLVGVWSGEQIWRMRLVGVFCWMIGNDCL